MAPISGARTRLAHVLPPAFILSIIGTVESVYICLHLFPLLQLGVPVALRDRTAWTWGVVELAFSQSVAVMLLWCYVRAVLTNPGTVPKNSEYLLDTPEAVRALAPREFKLSGRRRHCKWCNRYKPDRTHHCRVCETCVLKMDHHCPWIMNCVGFRNHKFFMLLVGYTVLDCSFIVLTMAPTLSRASYEETPSSTRFCIVLGMTLAVMMGLLLSIFLSFHVWLMSRGMTTIEFCEKTVTQNAGLVQKMGANYDRGARANVEAVFGPRPLLWLLPLSPSEGDGLHWKVADSQRAREPRVTDPEWTGGERCATN